MAEQDPKPKPRLQPLPKSEDVRPAVEPAEAGQRRYRCFACLSHGGRKLGRDFLASTDTLSVSCPNCGLEAADPKGGALIVPVAVVHYEPPKAKLSATVRRMVGADRVACDAEDAGPASGRGIMRTGEPAAVTCPACRGSEAFKAEAGAVGLDPRFDLPVKPAAGGSLVFEGLPEDATVRPHR